MQSALELTGLFAFGMSGALMAIRRDFDVIGIAFLAVITALGGGILRDVVLGDTPPPAFTDWEYLGVPLAAAALTFFAHPALERLMRTLLVFDAAGLGLFCVTGTVKALDYGLAPVAAAALGVTTAVGGGLLRDITANEVPRLFDARDLYALPALLGAVLTAILWELRAFNDFSACAVAALVFAFRVVAWRWSWRIPLAVRGWHRLGLEPGNSRGRD